MSDIKPAVWSDEIDRILASGTDEEMRGLVGVAGLRFEPSTWEELKAAVAQGDVQGIKHIGRTPWQYRVYREHKVKVLSQYATLVDYIRHTILHYPVTPRDQDGKLVTDAHAPVPSLTVWERSEFPYFMEEGLEHHIVWSTNSLTHQELQRVIKENCQGREVLHWVNPTPLQSIPGVWHAHVVSRPKMV